MASDLLVSAGNLVCAGAASPKDATALLGLWPIYMTTDQWSVAGNIATISSVVIAFAAAVFAYRQYVNGRYHSNIRFLNDIFRDYLKTEIDYLNSVRSERLSSTEREKDLSRNRLISLLIYTLEETFLFVKNNYSSDVKFIIEKMIKEKKYDFTKYTNRTWLFSSHGSSREIARNWLNTIMSYVDRNNLEICTVTRSDIEFHMASYGQTYAEDFVDFLRECCLLTIESKFPNDQSCEPNTPTTDTQVIADAAKEVPTAHI
ncbi:hypothetical protein [Sphingobium indicum]|nr:hypothetical protein [Sphingobium indicum]